MRKIENHCFIVLGSNVDVLPESSKINLVSELNKDEIDVYSFDYHFITKIYNAKVRFFESSSVRIYGTGIQITGFIQHSDKTTEDINLVLTF